MLTVRSGRRHLIKAASVTAGCVGAAFVIAPYLVDQVSAKELSPDLNQYCKERWENSQARYSQRYRKWICQIGREEQAANTISLNEACASQFGAGAKSYVAGSDPRSREPVVRCHVRQADGTAATDLTGSSGSDGAPAPLARRTVKVDLNEYCRSQHGPGFFPTRRITDNHPLCTKQNIAGGSQVHITVDTAKACPAETTFDRVEGDTMVCTGPGGKGSKSASVDKQQQSESGTGSGVSSSTSAASDEPQGDVATSTNTPNRSGNQSSTGTRNGIAALPEQFRDCGIASASGWTFAQTRAMDQDWMKRWRWEIATPCPGLTGGIEISQFDKYCGYYDMTRPQGSRFLREIEINSPTYKSMFHVFGWDGDRPTCKKGVHMAGGHRSKPRHEIGMHPGPTCSNHWYRTQGFDFAGLWIVEKRTNDWTKSHELDWKMAHELIPPSVNRKYPDIAYRYVNRRLTCFYFPQGTIAKWSTEERPIIRFVWQGDRGFEEIKGDLSYYGGPVYLEIDYENEQEEDTFIATLEWDTTESGGLGRSEILTRRTPEDLTLYRSGSFDIDPSTPIADSARGIPSIPPAAPGPPEVRP